MTLTTINLAALGDTINLTTEVTGTLPIANGGTAATSYTPGITMADNWRLSTNETISVGTNFLTTNWEKNDSTGYGGIGTGLTESSGVFTFPITGIYLLTFELYATLENDETGLKGFITISDDNYVSTYYVAYGSVGIQRSSGNYEMSSVTQFIFDCTNTSTHKTKFGYVSELAPASSVIGGATGNNRTNFIATRLGDT
tara:strand:- start:4433 stop:5029 length:597 start_codon:yes stop_codon:yes gene_type:complete